LNLWERVTWGMTSAAEDDSGMDGRQHDEDGEQVRAGKGGSRSMGRRSASRLRLTGGGDVRGREVRQSVSQCWG
jgi:hypothetical protein